MSLAPLETERLRLIPATLELADADRYNRLEFSHRLGASVPDGWPPPRDDEALERAIAYLRRDPGAAGWADWYWVAKKHKPVVVGQGGFKGRPDAGVVEMSCSLLPAFQRRGYAAEAVAALLDWAFTREEVERVVAEALPEPARAIRLLERAGFAKIGPGSEEGAIRFELRRRLSR